MDKKIDEKMERNIQDLNNNYENIDNRISRIKEEMEEQPESGYGAIRHQEVQF